MTTAAQYQHRLSELDFSALDQPLTNETMTGLETLQNHLAQLEQDINREIHIIRNQYQTRIDSVNRGSSSRILTSNKQATSGAKRADELGRLENERDEKIAPFQATKDSVLDYQQRVEAAKTAAAKS
jgi:hypothetical protein